MLNNQRLRVLLFTFPLALVLGLSMSLSAGAQISIALGNDGGTNIDLGVAGPGKSIDFFIGQNIGSNDDLGAVFAVVTISGGVVDSPAGIISADGDGTPGFFGAGNLFESTIGPGDSDSQFEVNQFFNSSQPVMTATNRELWFTLNLDTTGLPDGDYTITLEDSNQSFRASDGTFIAANNDLSFTVSSILIGDVNLDGVVDFLDISPFIGVLSSGLFQVEADCDGNGTVDFLDISAFIAILSGA